MVTPSVDVGALREAHRCNAVAGHAVLGKTTLMLFGGDTGVHRCLREPSESKRWVMDSSGHPCFAPHPLAQA